MARTVKDIEYFFGDSQDEKPTYLLAGSKYKEEDTQKWFTWDGVQWLESDAEDMGNINFIGSVSADGSQGLTGQKTIAGYTFTFKKGLLVGFQAP